MSQHHAAPSSPSPDELAARWATLAADDASGDDSLSCPGCGASLAADLAFEQYRVCPGCDRHFPLPARERLALLIDPGSFAETNGVLVALSPLIFRDHLPLPDTSADQLAPGGPAAGLGEAVISGTATIGGVPVAVVVLDQTYLGGDLGPVAAEKVTLAIEQAASRRLPLIALCAASYPGGPSPDERRALGGLLSLAQWPKIAAAATALRETGAPFIAVLAHPTLGGVLAGLGLQADLILAEPGAHLGLTVSSRPEAAGLVVAEELLDAGQLDAVIDRRRLAASLGRLLALLVGGLTPVAGTPPAVATPPAPPAHWTEIALARHPARPPAWVLLEAVTTELMTLRGDRVAADDPALIGGLGRIGGRPVVVIAPGRPEAGAAPGPGITAAGYRKAARLLRLAVRFELPVVTLIDDAPAAMTTNDTGAALADLLALTSGLPVPMVSCVVGVGRGLALVALGVADRRLMLQHAMLTASTGGAGTSVPPAIAPTGAGWLARHPVTASDALRLGLIDQVVPEPPPGAHADPAGAAALLAAALGQALAEVSGVSSRRLMAARAHRLREVGLASPEGREAARREIRELQERQRSLAHSLAELRERWSDRTRRLPRLPRPSLPAVSHLPRPGQLDPARLGIHLRPELTDLAGRIADGMRHRASGAREDGAATERVPAESPE